MPPDPATSSENVSSPVEHSQMDTSPASDPMDGIVTTQTLNAIPQCLTEFRPFSQLPAELRWGIWDMVLRDCPPQVITVTLARVEVVVEDDPSDGDAPYGGLTYETEKCWGLYTVPTLLQVSVEARESALLVYKASFEDCFITPIYFDASRDTLFLDSCTTLTAFKYFKLSTASLRRMAEIQHLAIGGLVALFYRCLSDREFISRFETLSSLLLERGEPSRYWRQNDAEEASAITWFSECWSKEGTTEEGATGDAGAEEADVVKIEEVENAGPSIRFIDRQEMRALGMRPVGRFSVEGR